MASISDRGLQQEGQLCRLISRCTHAPFTGEQIAHILEVRDQIIEHWGDFAELARHFGTRLEEDGSVRIQDKAIGRTIVVTPNQHAFLLLTHVAKGKDRVIVGRVKRAIDLIALQKVVVKVFRNTDKQWEEVGVELGNMQWAQRQEGLVQWLGESRVHIPSKAYTEKCYLFMEYCNQGDLHDVCRRLLREEKELEAKQELILMRDIALGLKNLHALRLSHMDLKPENVVVYFSEGSFRAKLADLAFAAKIGFHPILNRGTRSYMSPRKWQLRFARDEVTPASREKEDLWL